MRTLLLSALAAFGLCAAGSSPVHADDEHPFCDETILVSSLEGGIQPIVLACRNPDGSPAAVLQLRQLPGDTEFYVRFQVNQLHCAGECAGQTNEIHQWSSGGRYAWSYDGFSDQFTAHVHCYCF